MELFLGKQQAMTSSRPKVFFCHSVVAKFGTIVQQRLKPKHCAQSRINCSMDQLSPKVLCEVVPDNPS